MVTEYTKLCVSLLLLSTFKEASAGNSPIRSSIYTSCNADMAHGSDVIDSVITETSVECPIYCTRREDCLSVNVCNADAERMTCEMLSAKVVDCDDLVTRTGCRYWEKEESDDSQCLNGGTPNQDPPCLCPQGRLGDYCERFIRGCYEGKESGLTGWLMSPIQPVGCPYPIMAYCIFDYGATYIIRRGYQADPLACIGNNLDPNMAWNGYKNPFGVKECDMFLGLENIWYILRQGSYNMDVYLQYYDDSNALKDAQAFYWNFKMASAENDYEIEYSSFSGINGAEDGLLLGANNPNKFCTHDRDCGTCAQAKGVAWWYTPNCDNYPLTVDNGNLKWPVSGIMQNLSLAIMQIWPNHYY